MKEKREVTVDLLDVLQELLSHAFIIIACTVIAAVVGYCYANFALEPVYQSSATFIVNTKVGEKDITNDNVTSATKLANTYKEIFKYDTVLQPVVDNLGLSMTAKSLSGKVSVSAVTDTQLMRIKVRNSSKAKAFEICNEICKVAPDVLTEVTDGAGSIKVVEHPCEAKQAGNAKKKYAMLGAIAAFLIASIGVIIASTLNNKVKGESDITESLGLPVLGVIPVYDGGNNNGK